MEKVKSADGTVIAFQKTGVGPALINVDGAFCYSSYGPASKLASLLMSSFTVYSYDRRGRGESTDVHPHSVEKEVDDLKALIDITGERPYVFGNSAGGALVVQALTKGANMKKAAIFEPPYVIRDKSQVSYQEIHRTLTELISDHKKSEAVTYFLKNIMGMSGIAVALVKLLQNKSWKKNETVSPTLAYDVALMEDRSVLTSINTISNIPILVIDGEKSPPPMKRAVQEVSEKIKHSSLKILKGQHHNLSMEVLAPELISFFLRQD